MSRVQEIVLLVETLALIAFVIKACFPRSSTQAVNEPRVPSIYDLPPLASWGEDDVIAWRTFLGTETGRKLKDRSRSMVAHSCTTLCGDPTNTAHSAGTGHGMSEFLTWQLSLASDEALKRLSQPTGAQVDNTSEGDGQASLLERLSP